MSDGKHKKAPDDCCITEAELVSIGRLLEESLNEIYIFNSHNMQFVLVNRGGRANLGYTMDELRVMTPLDLKPDFTLEQFDELLGPLRNGAREKIKFETHHKRKDGSFYDVEVHLQQGMFQDKPVYMAMIQDITEFKQAEAKILQSNEELERFAYMASHDLQQPVRQICNFTQMLQEEYGAYFDEAAQTYVDYIVKASKKMQMLIADLLAYSRLDQEDTSAMTFKAQESVDQSLANLREIIKAKQAHIDVSDLPEIHTNPIRFGRLMENLISNALKYQEEGRAPEIKIEAQEQDNSWLFSVRDNGIGMEQGDLDKIFDAFKRVCDKDRYEGSGIGLAACKKIVESMNGKIWAESKPGEGSTFFFTIPRV